MAESTNLKTAVDAAVKTAEHDVKTGNVSTSSAPPRPNPAPKPSDLPTGTRRSHPPE